MIPHGFFGWHQSLGCPTKAWVAVIIAQTAEAK